MAPLGICLTDSQQLLTEAEDTVGTELDIAEVATANWLCILTRKEKSPQTEPDAASIAEANTTQQASEPRSLVTLTPLGPGDIAKCYLAKNGLDPAIKCQACHSSINIKGHTQSAVIKCGLCKELTPIKTAPPRMVYVRCHCNGLYTQRKSRKLFGCLRPNCKRLIYLGSATSAAKIKTQDFLHVVCGQCNASLMWNRSVCLAACSKCKTKTTIRPRCNLALAILYFVGGLIWLTVGIDNLTENTWARSIGFTCLYFAEVFVLFPFHLLVAIYYQRMKRSRVDGPWLQQDSGKTDLKVTEI